MSNYRLTDLEAMDMTQLHVEMDTVLAELESIICNVRPEVQWDEHDMLDVVPSWVRTTINDANELGQFLFDHNIEGWSDIAEKVDETLEALFGDDDIVNVA